MKPTILNRMAGAAVVLALPAVMLAQDLTPDPSSTGKSSGSMPPAPGAEASSSGGTFAGESGQQEGTFSSGIIVEGGSAYVIHKLQNEMALPDGSKVAPNGTITKSDGSIQQMDKGKVLSLDGRIMEGPFKEEQKQSIEQPPSGVTSPEKPRMPSAPESTPQAPQSGVGVPESGSPFSSPSAPGESEPSSSPDPSQSLDTPQASPDSSAEELTPEYTD